MNNTTQIDKTDGSWTTRLVCAGLILFIAGLAIGQAELSPFAAMLSIALGSLLTISAAAIVIINIIRSKGISNVSAIGWLAITLGALTLSNVGNMGGGGAPIHDISTDTQNPPAFRLVATLRGTSDNPIDYLDDGTAELQAQAYPDIKTIILSQPPEAVFSAALAAAKNMGWEIVASVPAEGHIEATATTPFVAFKDDVVIRVRAGQAGTLVDVRSKSRIGKGDMGVNAARIRAYTAELTGIK
ncbi:MAG: DUF1499 domain-containing protein [Gammaproteobacteria bacterium]|nr:DUF1499 domain-containing protein [Gammaproteobacteria bacterium]MCP4089754.1 DUF1499 domain-containing protein [Gammaproteobacteria bacterium]MCP4278229.1 DUF1499 domain-containing protein [Gammaproteobacteria bacterium]MCP4831948.1 DUF1499 domain-containing protein [Gammaproteobacteria bacterium]MCP4927580.1 DUF1499 domain-containing protein [Gammaproteobacteria bacterium]